MQDTYVGSTAQEMSRVTMRRRLGGVINQTSLFDHQGDISLAERTLTLGAWLTLTPQDVDSVRQDFTSDYGRFSAGGARGGFPSFGVFKKSGAPLVLQLRGSEQLLLLVGFAWLSGKTENHEWLSALQDFAAQG